VEKLINNFGFIVLGLVLTACLFFGFIAWINALQKERKRRKDQFNRKIDAIRRAAEKVKVKSEPTKPPLDYPGTSFRSSRHDSVKVINSRPTSISHDHSRYDDNYQRSAIPAYALLADDDGCNRRHSSSNDHSPSHSSSCPSFSSDSGSSSSDNSSSSCN
jgi:hypothetical protein